MTNKAKERYNWAYKAIVIALLTGLVGMTLAFAPKAIDAINNRTFGSVQEKIMTIEGAKHHCVVGEAEKEILMMHTGDEDYHMSFEEKAAIIRIEGNQKRIGQDLQEIKQLLKN